MISIVFEMHRGLGLMVVMKKKNKLRKMGLITPQLKQQSNPLQQREST